MLPLYYGPTITTFFEDEGGSEWTISRALLCAKSLVFKALLNDNLYLQKPIHQAISSDQSISRPWWGFVPSPTFWQSSCGNLLASCSSGTPSFGYSMRWGVSSKRNHEHAEMAQLYPIFAADLLHEVRLVLNRLEPLGITTFEDPLSGERRRLDRDPVPQGWNVDVQVWLHLGNL